MLVHKQHTAGYGNVYAEHHKELAHLYAAYPHDYHTGEHEQNGVGETLTHKKQGKGTHHTHSQDGAAARNAVFHLIARHDERHKRGNGKFAQFGRLNGA